MSGHRQAGTVSPAVIVREFLLASQGRARSGLEMAMYLESALDIALGDADIGRLESILTNAGNAGDGGAGDGAAADEGTVGAVLALVSGGSEPNGHG